MNFRSIQKIIFIFLTVLITFVIIFGAYSILKSFNQPKYSFNMSSRTVIKELKELNRLETSQFTIEKVIDAGRNGNVFQQFLFGDRILLVAQGEVIAGFDLSKLKESDINIDGTTVRLTLPQPEILITTLNNDQTRVYDRRLGLLSKGDKDLESNAREVAEQSIRQGACDGKILDQASTNGRNQLTALLKALGFTTVVITIPQGICE